MSWVTHNFALKALSVALALATWGGVAYANNPAQSALYRMPLATVGHLPPGLVATSSVGQVTVTVDGLQSSINSFRRDSLHASVDISNAHIGANHFPVRVLNDDPDVRVREIQPSLVELSVDQVGTVVKTLDVRVTGSPQSGYQPGAPAATPSTVTLSGPQSLLQSAVAFVTVDIGGRAADVQANPDVKIEKPDGTQVSNLVVSQPSQVQVTVPLNRTAVQVKVALVGNYIGQPASGFHVSGTIDVVPNVITVQGDPAVIAKLTSIELDAVDVSGRSADVSRTVTLHLPAGVTIFGGTNQVTETVHIAADARPSPQPSPTTPSPSPTPSPAP